MLLLCLNPTLNGMTIDATGHASFTAKGSRAQKMKFSIKDFFSKCDQINVQLHFLCGEERDEFRGNAW